MDHGKQEAEGGEESKGHGSCPASFRQKCGRGLLCCIGRGEGLCFPLGRGSCWPWVLCPPIHITLCPALHLRGSPWGSLSPRLPANQMLWVDMAAAGGRERPECFSLASLLQVSVVSELSGASRPWAPLTSPPEGSGGFTQLLISDCPTRPFLAF